MKSVGDGGGGVEEEDALCDATEIIVEWLV